VRVEGRCRFQLQLFASAKVGTRTGTKIFCGDYLLAARVDYAYVRCEGSLHVDHVDTWYKTSHDITADFCRRPVGYAHRNLPNFADIGPQC